MKSSEYSDMEQSMFCSSECSELFEIMNRRWSSSSLSVSLGGNEKEPLFSGTFFSPLSLLTVQVVVTLTNSRMLQIFFLE